MSGIYSSISSPDPSFDSLAPTTTKGDLIVHDATTNVRLPVGTDGQVLTADSTDTNGLVWEDVSAGYDVSNFSGGKEYICEMFMGLTPNYSLGWSIAVANGGSVANTIISGHAGVVQLARNTTATGKAIIRLANNSYLPYAFKKGWYVQIPTLSDGTNRFDTEMGIGFAFDGSSPVSDGFFFRYVDDENSGNWTINSTAASSTTTADTGIAADTNWNYFEIESNAASTSISFYINGVETANSPLTTNIPGPAAFMVPHARIGGTDGTSNRVLNIDSFYFLMNP